MKSINKNYEPFISEGQILDVVAETVEDDGHKTYELVSGDYTIKDACAEHFQVID